MWEWDRRAYCKKKTEAKFDVISAIAILLKIVLNLNFFITKGKGDYAKLQNLPCQEEECISQEFGEPKTKSWFSSILVL